jgi:hypothetical protein
MIHVYRSTDTGAPTLTSEAGPLTEQVDAFTVEVRGDR